MHRIIAAAVLVISVIQVTTAFCCYRDALMLTPYCACSEIYLPCGCNNQPGTNICSNTCGCQSTGSCYSCFRNIGCNDQGSNSCSKCDCKSKGNDCSKCDCKSKGNDCSKCDCKSKGNDCLKCDCKSKGSCYKCFQDNCNKVGSNGCSNCECSKGPCDSCFTKCPSGCYVCGQSPLCSCLEAANVGSVCGCETSRFYFPEVVYPVSIIDVNPYYCGVCFSY